MVSRKQPLRPKEAPPPPSCAHEVAPHSAPLLTFPIHTSFLDQAFVGAAEQQQFFWRYGSQSRTTKSSEMRASELMRASAATPTLKVFSDPVFQGDVQEVFEGLNVRHEGRPRKGDATDDTPKPHELHTIGEQLRKLQQEHDQQPVRARTDRNKYASKICRLKKRAQSEANKIWYEGIKKEYECVRNQCHAMEDYLAAYLQNPVDKNPHIFLQEEIARHQPARVVGNNDQHVFSILLEIKNTNANQDVANEILRRGACPCTTRIDAPSSSNV